MCVFLKGMAPIWAWWTVPSRTEAEVCRRDTHSTSTETMACIDPFVLWLMINV